MRRDNLWSLSGSKLAESTRFFFFIFVHLFFVFFVFLFFIFLFMVKLQSSVTPRLLTESYMGAHALPVFIASVLLLS